MTDKEAHVLFSDHNPTAANSAPACPEIDRGALRKILLNSLWPGTVKWDRQFVSMERQGAGWRLHFKQGSAAYAGLVIGGDSANSKIRPYITPIKAIYAGITMLKINVPEATATTPSASYPTVHTAIAAYEVAMRARAAQATHASLANGERMHSPDALEIMLALFTGR